MIDNKKQESINMPSFCVMSKCVQAVQQMINSLEKNFITPQRKNGYLGAAQCCDKGLSAEQLQRW